MAWDADSLDIFFNGVRKHLARNIAGELIKVYTERSRRVREYYLLRANVGTIRAERVYVLCKNTFKHFYLP